MVEVCPLWVKSRHVQCTRRCLLCAKSRLMRRSKQHLYSITSSAIASSAGRHVEAERLGGLEIDHQFKLGRSACTGRSAGFSPLRTRPE